MLGGVSCIDGDVSSMDVVGGIDEVLGELAGGDIGVTVVGVSVSLGICADTAH